MYRADCNAQLEEVHNTIDYLQWELMSNVNSIQEQLQMFAFSSYERELAAAKMFVERFQVLVEASRSQLSTLQTGGLLQWNNNQLNLNHGLYYNNSPPSYSWNGYYGSNGTTQKNWTKNRKRKATASNTITKRKKSSPPLPPQVPALPSSVSENTNPGAGKETPIEVATQLQIKKEVHDMSSLSSTNISPIKKSSIFNNNILEENAPTIKTEIHDDGYMY